MGWRILDRWIFYCHSVGEEVNWLIVEEYIRKQGKTPEQV